jgi:hypothetical protein
MDPWTKPSFASALAQLHAMAVVLHDAIVDVVAATVMVMGVGFPVRGVIGCLGVESSPTQSLPCSIAEPRPTVWTINDGSSSIFSPPAFLQVNTDAGVLQQRRHETKRQQTHSFAFQ